jgi:hypothetical protein
MSTTPSPRQILNTLGWRSLFRSRAVTVSSAIFFDRRFDQTGLVKPEQMETLERCYGCRIARRQRAAAAKSEVRTLWRGGT